MHFQSLNEVAPLGTRPLCVTWLRRGIRRKLSHLLHVVTHQNGSICMLTAGIGEWPVRNARNGEIKRNWSAWSSIALDTIVTLIDMNSDRQLRQACPNSMIARELDQVFSTMKWGRALVLKSALTRTESRIAQQWSGMNLGVVVLCTLICTSLAVHSTSKLESIWLHSKQALWYEYYKSIFNRA